MALYTSLSPEISMAELMRHLTADMLPFLNSYRLTELAVDLSFVVDCTNPALIGLTLEDLVGDLSYEYTGNRGSG
jgi:hypothetical protein